MSLKRVNERHRIDRERRPSTLARAAASSMLYASIVLTRLWPTASADRGDRPPEISKIGTLTLVRPRQRDRGGVTGGAPSTIACPLAPVIPELGIAIRARPLEARTRRGSGSRGTRRRCCFQLISGFLTLRLAFGGMTPCSRIPQTLQREARKEAISKCLIKISYQYLCQASNEN